MSLFIHPYYVTSVLLADGWHEVAPNKDFDPDQPGADDGPFEFELDSYEFGYEYYNYDERKTVILHGGGQSGICATGFTFTEMGTRDLISGPLTSIIAVKHAPPSSIPRI